MDEICNLDKMQDLDDDQFGAEVGDEEESKACVTVNFNNNLFS